MSDDNEEDPRLEALRWGPDGRWTIDDLGNAIESDLLGFGDWDVGVRVVEEDEFDALEFRGSGEEYLRAVKERGKLCDGHLFGNEAIAFVSRHLDVPFEVTLWCRWSKEHGWVGAVRNVDFRDEEPIGDEGVRRVLECSTDFMLTFAVERAPGIPFAGYCTIMGHGGYKVVMSAADYRGRTPDELRHAHETPLERWRA